MNILTRQVYAILSPASPMAEDSLHLRRNRPFLTRRNQSDFPALAYDDCRTVIQLDFASTLGRGCVSLGSSRASDIQLPAGDGIHPQHVALFFDASTRMVNIKDTSPYGIWLCPLQPNTKQPPTCLHKASTPITSSVLIQLGHNNRLRFELHVDTSGLCDAHFTTYNKLITILKEPPLRTKRRQNSGSEDSHQYKRWKGNNEKLGVGV
jgi:hypothetical protein